MVHSTWPWLSLPISTRSEVVGMMEALPPHVWLQDHGDATKSNPSHFPSRRYQRRGTAQLKAFQKPFGSQKVGKAPVSPNPSAEAPKRMWKRPREPHLCFQRKSTLLIRAMRAFKQLKQAKPWHQRRAQNTREKATTWNVTLGGYQLNHQPPFEKLEKLQNTEEKKTETLNTYWKKYKKQLKKT